MEHVTLLELWTLMMPQMLLIEERRADVRPVDEKQAKILQT